MALQERAPAPDHVQAMLADAVPSTRVGVLALSCKTSWRCPVGTGLDHSSLAPWSQKMGDVPCMKKAAFSPGSISTPLPSRTGWFS